jgi:6-pyruvoyltetrahydropterin/6-carboxytetrahydropterin synthase
MFHSTKRYGHEVGLSACFRQWRAGSHCHYLHGYALSVEFTFAADTLDTRNWVVDFGGLKDLRRVLEDTFDHKTVVAADDPHMNWFAEGDRLGVLDLVVLPHVGCEMFAEYAGRVAQEWLAANGLTDRVALVSCEVREHGANGAVWTP